MDFSGPQGRGMAEFLNVESHAEALRDSRREAVEL